MKCYQINISVYINKSCKMVSLYMKNCNIFDSYDIQKTTNIKTIVLLKKKLVKYYILYI